MNELTKLQIEQEALRKRLADNPNLMTAENLEKLKRLTLTIEGLKASSENTAEANRTVTEYVDQYEQQQPQPKKQPVTHTAREWAVLAGRANEQGEPKMTWEEYQRGLRGQRLHGLISGVSGVGRSVVNRVGENFGYIEGFGSKGTADEGEVQKKVRGITDSVSARHTSQPKPKSKSKDKSKKPRRDGEEEGE